MLFEGAKQPAKKKKRPEPADDRPRVREKPHTADDRRTFRYWQNRTPPADPIELQFRHSHWAARRAKIRQHLVNAHIGEFKLDAWDNCGSECHCEYSPSRKKNRLRAWYCKSRFCEPCARAKANTIARNLRDRMTNDEAEARRRAGRDCRFITLTRKHTTEPLQDQIRDLMACFKELRRSKVWKRRVEGGAAILEIKWTGKDWHPHLHMVAEGTYFPWHELSQAWLHASGSSFVADIRKLDRPEDAVHYVTKYITKGVNGAVWDDDDAAQEFILSMHRVRCCYTFGSWRKWPLLKRTSGENDWRRVARLTEIYHAAQRGELWATGLLLELRPPGCTDEVRPRKTAAP